MVNNIIAKVRGFTRKVTPKSPVKAIVEAVPIRIISTYGSNDFMLPTLMKYEKLLRESFSFGKLSPNVKLFNHVYRTAPKLGSLLSSTKQLVIGNGPGPTVPCGSSKCESCPLMTNSSNVTHKGKDIGSKHASCISRNVIYFVTCLLCLKAYLGKTVTIIRTRINGHRALYYKIIKNHIKTITDNKYNDDLSLAYHLHKEHNCVNRSDFNKYYRFTIIQHCNPDSLDVAEHKAIHRWKTLEPGGINASNPFSIPLVQ